MLTDKLPSNESLRAEYFTSDGLHALDVPQDERLTTAAAHIRPALESGESRTVRQPCAEFLFAAADFYAIDRPQIRVLAARPLRVHEGRWATELFGDYHPDKKLIRVWMRTAIRKQVTSFGTFLSRLCHESSHHLDIERLGFTHTPHTRGFYERAAVLYHHARGTPPKPLFWAPVRGGRFRSPELLTYPLREMSGSGGRWRRHRGRLGPRPRESRPDLRPRKDGEAHRETGSWEDSGRLGERVA
jgi:hypothetical protein